MNGNLNSPPRRSAGYKTHFDPEKSRRLFLLDYSVCGASSRYNGAFDVISTDDADKVTCKACRRIAFREKAAPRVPHAPISVRNTQQTLDKSR